MKRRTLSLKDQLMAITWLESNRSYWEDDPGVTFSSLAPIISLELNKEITPPNLKTIFEAKGYKLFTTPKSPEARLSALESRFDKMEEEISKWQ